MLNTPPASPTPFGIPGSSPSGPCPSPGDLSTGTLPAAVGPVVSQVFDTDVLVLGCGPAGQRAAVQAAKLGRSVTVIDERGVEGGVCLHTGTIPSKTLREAVLRLVAERKTGTGRVTAVDMAALRSRIAEVTEEEVRVIKSQLSRNGIQFVGGRGKLLDAHTVEVTTSASTETEVATRSFQLTGRNVILATGSKPRRPANIAFDGENVIDSDDVLKLKEIPKSLVVVGGGVIGSEYASMFATLGVKVTIVEKAPTILGFMDGEMIAWLKSEFERIGITHIFNHEVKGCYVDPRDKDGVCEFTDGSSVRGDVLLFCGGREPANGDLGLEALGVKVGDRGQVLVDGEFRTSTPSVFGAGDLIGPPSLASTSSQQGRRAALSACGVKADEFPAPLPVGIYAIPEVSFVGKTEEKLKRDGVPYETGVAFYRETGRGPIVGETRGMLKILVHRETREILGVHIGGYIATELVTAGQILMASKGKLDLLLNMAINSPTFSECYSIAALNCHNKLQARQEPAGVVH